MWIEISGELVNLNSVLRIVICREEHSIKLYFSAEICQAYSFENELSLEQVYFNILETIRSRPVDGFLERGE